LLPPSLMKTRLEQLVGRTGLGFSLLLHLSLLVLAGRLTLTPRPAPPQEPMQVVMRLQAPVPAPVTTTAPPPEPAKPQPRKETVPPPRPVPRKKPDPPKPEVVKEEPPPLAASAEPVAVPPTPVSAVSETASRDVPPAAPARPAAAVSSVPAAKPAVSAGAAVPQGEKEQLLAELLALIEREKFFPRLARRRGINGRADLIITIDGQGRIRDFQVASSSHAVFGSAADTIMGRVQRITASRALATARPMTISISLAFELKDGV